MEQTAAIRVDDHRAAIDRVLAYYGLASETLEVVPSVFDWCAANGVPENSIGRMAKCFCNWDNGECRIVMRDSFNPREFNSANYVMAYRGFTDEVELLDTPQKNLLHLLLHEIACHTLKTTEQAPRDTWAFAEMAKHEI